MRANQSALEVSYESPRQQQQARQQIVHQRQKQKLKHSRSESVIIDIEDRDVSSNHQREQRTLERYSYDYDKSERLWNKEVICVGLPAVCEEVSRVEKTPNKTRRENPIGSPPHTNEGRLLRQRPRIGQKIREKRVTDSYSKTDDTRTNNYSLPPIANVESESKDQVGVVRHRKKRELTFMELSNCLENYRKMTSQISSNIAQTYSPEYRDYYEIDDCPVSPPRGKVKYNNTGLPGRSSVLSPACLHRLEIIKRKTASGESPYDFSRRHLSKSETAENEIIKFKAIPPIGKSFAKEKSKGRRIKQIQLPVDRNKHRFSEKLKKVDFSRTKNAADDDTAYNQAPGSKLLKPILKQSKENDNDVTDSGYMSYNSADFVLPVAPPVQQRKPKLARPRIGADGGSGDPFDCSSAFKSAMTEFSDERTDNDDLLAD
ncbi:uncharacterized protein LOC141903908 [Tubulanus polymorphus]|uniref:uncharacterized protein LOC141903908 n=1 Tax=Tubulanus polymorphus TaxID=672921 RepID=UPI003DA4547F